MSLREENEKRDRQLKKEADLFRTGFNAGLDAAVEAARTRHRGQGAFQDTDSPMGWEFNAGIREAIEAINKLRNEK